MAARYRSAMDGLYLACTAIAGLCLVVISLVIPWGVFTRYVLNHGSSWPEPMSTLLMALFSFIGAAAGYRANAHLAVNLATNRLPPPAARAVTRGVEAALALLCLFIIVWGIRLVAATWGQYIAEFPWLSTGVTYLPVPAGGAATLLFVVERAWLGPPPAAEAVHDA